MMNMEEKALAGCIGKEPFTERERANKAARRRGDRVSYKCQNCGMWHVGTISLKKGGERRGHYHPHRKRRKRK